MLCKGGSCNSCRSAIVKHMMCGEYGVEGGGEGGGDGVCVDVGGSVVGGGGGRQEKTH